jgi:hypoxanthine phosphoribosyltransferase
MRGGAPIIDVLSRVFKLKCAYLAVESYSGKGTEDQQGELVFSREISSTVQDMGGRLLLCDDLSDTGVTLQKSINWLRNYPAIKNIESIKTAVLWKKKDSTFEPDYCAQRLDDNPWIVQPFENYEEVRIEELVKKHKK